MSKIDGTVIMLIGALGWVLASNDETGPAVALALTASAIGIAGAAVGVLVRSWGGHQMPAFTASFGHLAPSLARGSALVLLGWVGAWAAAEAGAKEEGLAVAASVAVFTALGEVVKPIKEATDALRPSAFGKAAIQHHYGARFDVDPSAPTVRMTNARAAVHDDLARIHDDGGVHTFTIEGWGLDARRQRLEVIAASV